MVRIASGFIGLYASLNVIIYMQILHVLLKALFCFMVVCMSPASTFVSIRIYLDLKRRSEFRTRILKALRRKTLLW